MALLETSGFDTGEIRQALDEYDRREQKRSVQMGAVFLQSMRLLEDAGRLYEENDRLRELVNSYADLFEKEAAANNGNGPYYSGEDWLALANDMRIELAKCCGELGIEVE